MTRGVGSRLTRQQVYQPNGVLSGLQVASVFLQTQHWVNEQICY
ncbi:MAG: hypothetical protein ACR2N1_17690 [Rubripirellula sp.]